MVEVKETRDVADAAFDALVSFFGDHARVAIVVLFCESSFHAGRKNGSGAPYYGLNQIGEKELAVYKLTPATWLSMPAERQVPVVYRFWEDKFGRFGDWMWEAPEHLYGCNFLPARCTPDMPRDRPLTKKGDRDWKGKDGAWHSFYESNTGLDLVAEHFDADGNHRYDVGKDGVIDLEDFAAWIAHRRLEEPKRIAELEARLEDAFARVTPATDPTIVAADDQPVFASPDPEG